MTSDGQVLAAVVADLRSSFGGAVQVLENDKDAATLRIGLKASGVIRIWSKDAARPSFGVSYPALKTKRNRRRHVELVEAEAVLYEGLRWIVSQIVQHGAVRPELE